jgi:hypothetical protein
MSGRMRWDKVRLHGRQTLDHRREFEREDRTAKWIRQEVTGGGRSPFQRRCSVGRRQFLSSWASPALGLLPVHRRCRGERVFRD